MAGIGRVHGQPDYGTSLNVTGQKGAFLGGYQPLFIKIAYAGVATLDTVDGTTNIITDGTRAKSLRAIETLGSVLMCDDASATTAITVMVDGASFNQGAGATTSGTFGALKDAVAAATSISVGSLTVTSGNGITSAGSLNLA
jgi:hypothetical protein